MPKDLKDIIEGTVHCCYCGRRFKKESELKQHYRVYGKVHFETSIGGACKANF